MCDTICKTNDGSVTQSAKRIVTVWHNVQNESWQNHFKTVFILFNCLLTLYHLFGDLSPMFEMFRDLSIVFEMFRDLSLVFEMLWLEPCVWDVMWKKISKYRNHPNTGHPKMSQFVVWKSFLERLLFLRPDSNIDSKSLNNTII